MIVQPLRLVARLAPPPPSPAVVPEDEAARVVDAYLTADRGERVRAGSLSAGIQLGAGLAATVGGCLAGVPGVVVATAVATGAGVVLGLRNARRDPAARGDEKFWSAYLSCMLNGFQAALSGALAVAAGPVSGVLAALGGAALGGILSGASLRTRSTRAEAQIQDLDRRLDRAYNLEGVVLRSMQATEQPARPGGRVDVGGDYVTVGGIRVRRERRGDAAGAASAEGVSS